MVPLDDPPPDASQDLTLQTLRDASARYGADLARLRAAEQAALRDGLEAPRQLAWLAAGITDTDSFRSLLHYKSIRLAEGLQGARHFPSADDARNESRPAAELAAEALTLLLAPDNDRPDLARAANLLAAALGHLDGILDRPSWALTAAAGNRDGSRRLRLLPPMPLE